MTLTMITKSTPPCTQCGGKLKLIEINTDTQNITLLCDNCQSLYSWDKE